jgi:hypothetical protein
MAWRGWLGVGLLCGGPLWAGCSSGPLEVEDVKIGRWVVRKCEPRQQDALPDSAGNWAGELTFQQSVDGNEKAQLVEAELPGEGAQGLAPADALPSMGFLGFWRVYDAGPVPLDLSGLWGEGGEGGTLYAYSTNEQDGPANPLRVSEGEICETETSFEWQAVVEYPWVDLVDYTTYAYTAFDTPIVTLKVHEVLLMEEDTLVVASIAEGELEDGTPIELFTEGRLTR